MVTQTPYLHRILTPSILNLQEFFRKSKEAIEKSLPGTLFLGCRCHRGPNVLGRAAVGHADVFSVNVYDHEVRSWQVPDNADIPIIASEFHTSAADRGIPSPALLLYGSTSGASRTRLSGLSTRKP